MTYSEHELEFTFAKKHQYRRHFKAVVTEEKFAKSEFIKLTKHFLPKNYWSRSLSWLQFKFALIFQRISSLRTTSIAIPLRLLAKPVDLLIRKRSNSICHFHSLAGNSVIIFFTNPAFSQFSKSLLVVDSQLSEVSCSQIAHNMYPFPAVYQRIFSDMIHMVENDLFWAFWWKSHDSTANGCKITAH